MWVKDKKEGNEEVQRAFSCKDAKKEQGKGGWKRKSLRLQFIVKNGLARSAGPRSLIREVLHLEAMVLICTPGCSRFGWKQPMAGLA